VIHTYWVSCLYARRSTDADGAEVITYWETEPIPAGRATYVSRPILESPGDTDPVDIAAVSFEWVGPSGADQYVIEVSPSPDFVRSQTWTDVMYMPTAQDGTLFTKTYTNILSVATELASVPVGGTLYWRVGALNRADKPGPYPAGPSPQVSGAKNTRYTYSDPALPHQFTTVPDVPDPPPGDGGGGGEEPPPPPI
jgi:hypothetical protein